ncbi:MAG: chemotaxis protein CheW [Erythrobacter sp.]
MNEVIILAQIAGRPCAMRASEVETVIEIGTITPIPRAPPYILGLTALRSQALTVVDCRTIVGAELDDFTTDSRAAVVRVEGHSYALRVDEIRDVATTANEPETIAGGFGKVWSDFAEGLVETDAGPVLLISASKLLASTEKPQFAA